MENTIWVSRTSHGGRKSYCYSDTKPRTDSNDPTVRHNISDSGWWYIKADIYGTGVEQNELAEVIIDTETQTFTVKRERKKGWYLTRSGYCEIFIPRYWNGINFNALPSKIGEFQAYSESELTIDETPLTSPFLKEVKP